MSRIPRTEHAINEEVRRKIGITKKRLIKIKLRQFTVLKYNEERKLGEYNLHSEYRRQ